MQTAVRGCNKPYIPFFHLQSPVSLHSLAFEKWQTPPLALTAAAHSPTPLYRNSSGPDKGAAEQTPLRHSIPTALLCSRACVGHPQDGGAPLSSRFLA